MAEYTGDERREGKRDRRTGWSFWIAIVASVVGFALVSGAIGVGIERRSTPEVTIPDHTVALESLSTQLEALTLREPEVRFVVTERLVRDTVLVPYEVAMEPQIVRVHDTTEVLVFRVDTLWMPPQIITIPAPERGFWAAETYRPSIGNFVWSAASLSLGVLLQSAFGSSARACVVVNGEEACNF